MQQKSNTKIKLIFMGTPSIAASSLKALIDSDLFQIVAVICQPDKVIGRKKEIIFSEVKQLAISNNLKILQNNRIIELYEIIKSLSPDIILTCAFGQFIPEIILKIPKFKCVNLHASLLPLLRGGAPIHYAIINDFKETGFTLMYMEKKMDAGNIIKQFPLKISNDETYQSLYQKLKQQVYQISKEEIIQLCEKNIASFKQDESKVTFGYNISRENEKIDWNQSANKIDCFVRGLYDKPIAYTILGSESIKIHKLSILDQKSILIPGTIINISKNGIVITTQTNNILIERVQFPGKNPLYISQLINGKHPFKVGMRLL